MISDKHDTASLQNKISQNDFFRKPNPTENFMKVKLKNTNDNINIQLNSKNKNAVKISQDNIKQLNKIEECTDNIILNKFPPELLSKAKDIVQEAIKNNLIFSIYGPYENLRYFLRKRGWLEKQNRKPQNSLLNSKSFVKEPILKKISNPLRPKIFESYAESIVKNSGDEYTDNLSYEIASHLAYECSPDFIWSLKMSQIDMNTVKPNQLINHFQKSGSFTTKIGLIKSFNYLRWFEKNPDEVFPRSYIISDENEKKAFLNDYYFTACLSLVKLTSQNKNDISKVSDSNNEIKLDTNSSRNPIINCDNNLSTNSLNVIDRRYPEMAFHYCQLYLKALVNKDLDTKEVVFCSSKKWEDFFSNFWNVAFEGYGIQCTDRIRNQCKYLCNQFEKNLHQYNLIGTKNIWIVKPGAKSRGRGISCISKFSELNHLIQQSSEILIVQKYIECPLLVYNTKFDIRQWFLVTSWSPLIIWWYNDSYIRFCSQQFTLYDLNEAVHLSNNSIQYKYENGIRSKNLPDSNMWTWQSLEKYLNNHGYANGWQKSILPAMKNIIIDILLCAQEEIEDRKNSFELYGADFMVTENNLKTWLLEINSSPCLAPSTDITARLTKHVIEDLLKVILDYPKNIFCDTGQFELLYRQSPFPRSIIDSPNDLSVIGSRLRKSLSFLNSDDKVKQNQKCFNENHLLNNKLQHVIANSENQYVKIDKSSNLVKESQYRRYNNSVEYLQNSNHDNKLQMYKMLSFKRKSIRLKKENIFPVIKFDSEKSKLNCEYSEKHSKIGNEKQMVNKIDILRSNEFNSHQFKFSIDKRADQLMKAYMPTFGYY